MQRYTLLALLGLLCAAAPLAAQPYIYWANYGGTIGRVGVDGTGSTLTFIPSAGSPIGVATDGNYVYWTTGTAIGRANPDGSNANLSFISGTGFNYAVAASDSYIYWAGGSKIGRADLDGTNVNLNFITGLNSVTGVAINGTHIYWADNNGIGRANLDGTGVTQNLITTPVSPYHVAVDGNFVYWTNYSSSSTIGRANLDGTGADQSFISLGGYCAGVDTDDNYVYWGCSGGKIGRANLNGTNADANFITGASSVWGITVPVSSTLPVELVSFTATLDGNGALLRWTTVSETNNSGFDIEHRSGTDTFRSVGFAPGHGTTLETTRYAHTATGLEPGTHVFRLKQIDFDGAFDYSPEVELTLDADGLALALYGVPATDAIRGSLSVPSAQTASVTLYDALGRKVASQDDVSGAFMLDVSGFASGSYVLRVEAGAASLTRTVVIAR